MAYEWVGLNLGSNGRSERVEGTLVSGNYFDVLGVKAELGRTFLPDEDKTPGASPVAVISHNLWQRRFNSDVNVVGKSMVLNGVQFTIARNLRDLDVMARLKHGVNLRQAQAGMNVVASRLARSEEHTSELQSRFGISYAVFCLK